MFSRIQRVAFLAFLPSLAYAQAGNSYTQSNLVSDGSVKAQVTDTQLINPWGVAIGQQTPFWINTAGSGLSEVYDSGGNKQFVVKIPAAGASVQSGSPTGIAFNPSTTDFALPQGAAALFILTPSTAQFLRGTQVCPTPWWLRTIRLLVLRTQVWQSRTTVPGL